MCLLWNIDVNGPLQLRKLTVCVDLDDNVQVNGRPVPGAKKENFELEFKVR